MSQSIIDPTDLTQMQERDNIRIHLAYAYDAPPNIFGQIYREGAGLWLHEDMAAIVERAAQHAGQAGFGLLLYDGLRTIEAQAAMQKSPVVQANPHWLEDSRETGGRLLSPPGAGAHPRGMAIDLTLTDHDGAPLDMGTEFDFLAADSCAAYNPAHREHPDLSESVRTNRAALNSFMIRAASDLSMRLLLLPQEWWDFRFAPEIYEQYAPLSDDALPPAVKMAVNTRP